MKSRVDTCAKFALPPSSPVHMPRSHRPPLQSGPLSCLLPLPLHPPLPPSFPHTWAHMYISAFHHFMCPVHMRAKVTALPFRSSSLLTSPLLPSPSLLTCPSLNRYPFSTPVVSSLADVPLPIYQVLHPDSETPCTVTATTNLLWSSRRRSPQSRLSPAAIRPLGPYHTPHLCT